MDIEKTQCDLSEAINKTFDFRISKFFFGVFITYFGKNRLMLTKSN